MSDQPKTLRLTGATLAILDALAAATSDDPTYGLRLCQDTDLGPGTVYPILERLAKLGWVTVTEETAEHPGRPRRLYYELNNTGREGMRAALEVRAKRRLRWKSTLAYGGGIHE